MLREPQNISLVHIQYMLRNWLPRELESRCLLGKFRKCCLKLHELRTSTSRFRKANNYLPSPILLWTNTCQLHSWYSYLLMYWTIYPPHKQCSSLHRHLNIDRQSRSNSRFVRWF